MVVLSGRLLSLQLSRNRPQPLQNKLTSLKSLLSVVVVGAVVAATEETAEIVEAVEVVKVVSPTTTKISLKTKLHQMLSHIREVRSIQTYRQESGMGAECTENSAGGHTSVRNRRPVPGKISILKDLPNEILTSLAAHSILLFMTLFII